MNYAWPAAIAFVGMCAAIAYATAHSPTPPTVKSAQVTCIEQRGKWVPNWRGDYHGTCEFSATAAK